MGGPKDFRGIGKEFLNLRNAAMYPMTLHLPWLNRSSIKEFDFDFDFDFGNNEDSRIVIFRFVVECLSSNILHQYAWDHQGYQWSRAGSSIQESTLGFDSIIKFVI